MRNRWFIADTHFYHRNIVRYCHRPDNHEARIIRNLHTCVRPDDILIIGGDVHFGTEAQLRDILISTPGRKFLVRGNHDGWTDSKYMRCGFEGVFDALSVMGAYITHIPCTPPAGLINVHGHLHNLGYHNQETFKLYGRSYAMYYDSNHRLYAPELMGYRPITLQELLKNKNAPDRKPELLAGVPFGGVL